MKILGQFSPFVVPLTVAFSLLVSSGNAQASGPVAAGNAGTVGGTTTTAASAGRGTAPSSGPRAGVVATGNAGRSPVAPVITGARPTVSFSNSVPRMSTGNFARSGTGRANNPATYFQEGRAVSPTMNELQPAYRNPSRPNNAWNGTAVGPTDNALLRSNPSRRPSDPNGYANNRSPGQHLGSAANGANLPTINRWSSGGERRNGRYRYPYRYYSPYAYGTIYAPYIGYSGGYEGAYPYYADGVTSNGADVFNNGTATVAPQYTDQDQDASADQQNPAPQPVARQQSPDANAQRTVPDNGPDSLVEAVQEELIRRGYFAGKVDAMFNSDTKEALRKFQQDHHLADSGLINEATLHALQLD